MKDYTTVAFDLDGTLTNPERGLIAGFRYTFDKMGIECDNSRLVSFIGPPLFEEWQKAFGVSAEFASEMLRVFRVFYEVYGWWDNEIYDGVPEMLARLKSKGKKIVLATSKPEQFAVKILKLFKIDGYFDFIGGAADEKVRDKKSEVLEYSLKSVGALDSSRCVLVGDRVYDAEGARALGIDSIGVTYGHGSREEIEKSGFDYVVDSPSAVARLILGE